MQSIGGQLEEARQRKGISLREAAEATKIRSDFLGYIEQDNMDFDLPDIYKRGFLKNYAGYLKLDIKKIMTDYNAQLLSHSRKTKRGSAELFGQMEIKKPENKISTNTEKSDEKSTTFVEMDIRSDKNNIADRIEEESEKSFYLKVALIFIGTFALVFVIFGLAWAIIGKDKSKEINYATETQQNIETEVLDIEQASGADNGSITLIASGNVYVLVKQQSDNQELMRKTMSEGESITLEKTGAIDILFTAGEHLVIEHGGERLRPSSSGTAKISLQ